MYTTNFYVLTVYYLKTSIINHKNKICGKYYWIPCELTT